VTEEARPDSDRPDSGRPVKRSFRIRGHATSISLEGPFWAVLKQAAATRGISTAELVSEIDAARGRTNLSSAVRVWLLTFVQSRAKGE
jgi:predicted DNA-binding ribbon-helix-helix protein